MARNIVSRSLKGYRPWDPKQLSEMVKESEAQYERELRAAGMSMNSDPYVGNLNALARFQAHRRARINAGIRG